MKKRIVSFVIGLGSVLIIATPVFAHVVVTPKEVGIAKSQVFDVSVPTEKDIPTVALKLLIPKGVEEVTPNVKPGWTIHVVKNGDTVTEIDWTDGSIPAGQRDDFFFKAQAPAISTTLKWKAYQTYSDGSVVRWDQTLAPDSKKSSESTPYSTTQVINDLTASQSPSQQNSNFPILSFVISIIALVFSVVSLGIIIIGKNRNPQK